MLLRPSHFDRSAGALENAEIHNEQLTDQGFLDPRAKRGGFCPTTHLEITEKLLRCRTRRKMMRLVLMVLACETTPARPEVEYVWIGTTRTPTA